MTETSGAKGPLLETEGTKKTLTLGKKLELKKTIGKDQVRQSFSHGRSKTVEVEVKRKRLPTSERVESSFQNTSLRPEGSSKDLMPSEASKSNPHNQNVRLTHEEVEARFKAVQKALQDEGEFDREENSRNEKLPEEELIPILENSLEIKSQDLEEVKSPKLQDGTSSDKITKRAEVQAPKKRSYNLENFTPIVLRAEGYKPAKPLLNKEISKSVLGSASKTSLQEEDKFEIHKDPRIKTSVDRGEEGDSRPKTGIKLEPKKFGAVRKTFEAPRKLSRTVLTRALDGDIDERARSVASLKRARQKQKTQHEEIEAIKVIREVVIPESIMLGELANRMAIRGSELIKALMKMGMMVTINQVIDGDTAELLCTEFGHKPKRVADSDIEIGLTNAEDRPEDMVSRAPVVTIMGHVDHGKTSLLDALRKTDVAGGEAGGITQHIGAYQVTLNSGQKITFIDTPGHAAFSEMRARGANVTDIVVLVVAADDGIMEQTIEAISHAKAAKVPIIVAINKIDKPEANPTRVRNELLQHDIVLEEFGGEVMSVEVSAKKGLNLEKLEETILLQAEILDLKANPDRSAYGIVVEARIEKGRGSVATVLVQKGTLNGGDIFVAGSEWGRVRALVSDHGKPLKSATPSMPVEVLGLNGTPAAGEEFIVVDTELKAREITEYRQHRLREMASANMAKASMEQMMSKIASGETRELPLLIKTDVQGSLEAITTSLSKLSTDEVSTRILHGAVGGINESDITLAKASGGLVIGFNVRANPQAKDLARREGIEIRYYSIIYDVLNDVKSVMSGLLSPTLNEKFLGNAEIRTVFNITKVGKVAGCYITEGLVKRGAKVRLLRDNVVIHEGELKTLKRFKEEVKEVKESFECGMAFENYNDIRVGDFIECFEIESISRQL